MTEYNKLPKRFSDDLLYSTKDDPIIAFAQMTYNAIQTLLVEGVDDNVKFELQEYVVNLADLISVFDCGVIKDATHAESEEIKLELDRLTTQRDIFETKIRLLQADLENRK